MASAINNGTFVFTKEELKDWTKVIHQLTWGDTEIEKIMQIDEGIKYQQQLVIANNEGLLGKAVTGCTPNAISGVSLSEKTWNPVKEDFRLTHCSVDVDDQDKLINQYKKVNDDFYKIFEGSNSVVGQYLVASVTDRMKWEIIRKAWFNDTATATVANGGSLTNGTDIGYFNTFNGIFKQFFASATLPVKNRVTIAKNAGATYALQALVAGEGIAILRALYKKADPRLRAAKGAYFGVTRSVYDQYSDDLEGIQNAGAGNTAITENGQVVLKFKNIPVICMDQWDRTIDSYFNNGTKWALPNRAVLTTPDNVRVGTTAKSDFGTVKAFYDQVTNLNYVDGIYNIDAMIVEDYKIVMAY